MKCKFWILLVSTLMLVTVNWGSGNNKLTATLPVKAASSRSTSIGRIVSVAGDRLQLMSAANNIVLLSAQTRCNNPQDPKDCGGKPRGGLNKILKVISPRNTLLLNKPVLSWSAVFGATSYTVRVTGPGVKWESPPVKETKIAYPADASALQPERIYEVLVQADNGESGNATFKMLREIDAKSVRDSKDEIVKQNLPKDREALKLTSLYVEKKLFAEAIEILAAVKDKSQKADVCRTLGNLYLKVELPDLAKPEYEQELALATDNNERAAAQYRLGIVNVEIGENQDEAIRWLKAAWHSYEAANNTALKTDVAHYLGEVYRRTNNRDEAIRWFQIALTGYQTLKNPELEQEMQRQMEQLKP